MNIAGQGVADVALPMHRKTNALNHVMVLKDDFADRLLSERGIEQGGAAHASQQSSGFVEVNVEAASLGDGAHSGEDATVLGSIGQRREGDVLGGQQQQLGQDGEPLSLQRQRWQPVEFVRRGVPLSNVVPVSVHYAEPVKGLAFPGEIVGFAVTIRQIEEYVLGFLNEVGAVSGFPRRLEVSPLRPFEQLGPAVRLNGSFKQRACFLSRRNIVVQDNDSKKNDCGSKAEHTRTSTAPAWMVSVSESCYDAVIMDGERTGMQMRNAIEHPNGGARLISVGHSNHEWPAFLALLRQARVATVADVRSSPYSGRYPYFNREPLAEGLREQGIAYVFLGDSLGGRPQPRWLYTDELRVDYERVRQTDAFQRGLDQLLQAQDGSTVAFLCSEEDPLDCHRGLMIAPALCARGFPPRHLRKDGTVETTEEMERRLLQETGVGVGILDGLFAATLTEDERSALLAEAYRLRARNKAYRWQEEFEFE
jgi:hypothetical protein